MPRLIKNEWNYASTPVWLYCVDRDNLLKWIFKKWYVGMDWINLAQNRGSWRALANTEWLFRLVYHSPQTVTFSTNSVHSIEVGNVDRFLTGHCALTWSSDVSAGWISPFYLHLIKNLKLESHSLEIFPPRCHPLCYLTLTLAAVKGSKPVAFTFLALYHL